MYRGLGLHAGAERFTALESAELQRLVLEAVELYIDRAQLARQLAEERRQRRRLAEFLGRFGGSDGS